MAIRPISPYLPFIVYVLKIAFSLPHETILATLAWTGALTFNDIKKKVVSRSFVLVMLFWVYLAFICLVNCWGSMYILHLLQGHLPIEVPNILLASSIGLAGTVFAGALFRLTFKPIEGVELGTIEIMEKFRMEVVRQALSKRAKIEHRHGDSLAQMIADATHDVKKLEEHYMHIVGNTVSDPEGVQAKSAKEKMEKYKTNAGSLYVFHLGRSMIYSDKDSSVLYLRHLYWSKKGWGRYPRWILKGWIKATYLSKLA